MVTLADGIIWSMLSDKGQGGCLQGGADGFEDILQVPWSLLRELCYLQKSGGTWLEIWLAFLKVVSLQVILAADQAADFADLVGLAVKDAPEDG